MGFIVISNMTVIQCRSMLFNFIDGSVRMIFFLSDNDPALALEDDYKTQTLCDKNGILNAVSKPLPSASEIVPLSINDDVLYDKLFPRNNPARIKIDDDIELWSRT